MARQTITLHPPRASCFELARTESDPYGGRSRGLRGVLPIIDPVRLHPIALSELQVRIVDSNRLEVSDLNILDRTPIADTQK